MNAHTVRVNPAVRFDKRLELMSILTAFLSGNDHPPTPAEVAAFVDNLGDEKRREFLTALLLDATVGMTPPSAGRPL